MEAVRILRVGALFTILTDNHWFAQFLLRFLQESAGQLALRSKHLKVKGGESAGGFTLFEGAPGAEAGHIVQASSYFDRCLDSRCRLSR